MRSSFLLLLISLCAGAVVLTCATCPVHTDLTSPSNSNLCSAAGGTWNSGSSTCSPPSGGSLKPLCFCSSGYTCYNDNCGYVIDGSIVYMQPLNGGTCYVDPCPNCNGQGTCSKQDFDLVATCSCTTNWTPSTQSSADVCTVPPFTNCSKPFTLTQKGYVVNGLTAGVAAGTAVNTTCAAGYVVPDGSSISPASVTCLAAGGVYSSETDGFGGCQANATCPPIVIANSAFALDGDLCSSNGVTYVDSQCVFKCSDIYNLNGVTNPSGVFCRADGTYSGQPTGCGVATSSSTGSGSGNGTLSAASGQFSSIGGIIATTIAAIAMTMSVAAACF